jgi:Icc-related predicted phosphoesterase
LYFVTDVHGSNMCFRKFLNAASFYKADVLVLGGDITGKVLVPILDEGGNFTCNYQGTQVTMTNHDEVHEFRKRAADFGQYTHIVSPPELEELEADPESLRRLFAKLMLERVQEWTALAAERLGKSGVECLISPGNDDILDIDGVLDEPGYVVNPERRVVEVGAGHEMVTLGTTNRTPWKSPREVDEDQLAQMIADLADKVEDMERAIFNIHVPPVDTAIDQAPRVDADLRIVVKAGEVEMVAAGSSACRQAILRYQPLLGLHGHIHESRGIAKLGRTLCANPGSEYTEGILRGFLCELDGPKIRSYLLTSG